MDQIYRDFGITLKKLKIEQQTNLQQVFELLYTTLADVIEDQGNLQSEYE
jgi:hypothetical protein